MNPTSLFTAIFRSAILISLFNSRFVIQYFIPYSTAKNTPKNTQIVTQKKANGNINSFHVEEQTSSFLNLILKGITEILWNCANITFYTTVLPFIPLYYSSHTYLFMWYDVIVNTTLIAFLIFPLFSLFYYESTRFSLILRSKNLKISGNTSNETQSFLSKLILFVTENDLKGLSSYQGRHSFISSLCFTCLWLIFCLETILLFWTRMIVSSLLNLLFLFPFSHFFSVLASTNDTLWWNSSLIIHNLCWDINI